MSLVAARVPGLGLLGPLPPPVLAAAAVLLAWLAPAWATAAVAVALLGLAALGFPWVGLLCCRPPALPCPAVALVARPAVLLLLGSALLLRLQPEDAVPLPHAVADPLVHVVALAVPLRLEEPGTVQVASWLPWAAKVELLAAAMVLDAPVVWLREAATGPPPAQMADQIHTKLAAPMASVEAPTSCLDRATETVAHPPWSSAWPWAVHLVPRLG